MERCDVKHRRLLQILEDELFQEVIVDLKTDLLLRAMYIPDEQVLEVHKQIKAIDAVMNHLEITVSKYKGDY